MAYTPRTKIRQTVSAQVQENKFIRDSIDRGNMKIASIAKNIIAQYGIEPENIGAAAIAAYAQKGKLVNEQNTLQTQIEGLTAQLKVLKKYRKVKGIAEELKNLSGRQEKKFRKEHISELQEYGECRKQILEWYPSGTIPKVEQLEKKTPSNKSVHRKMENTEQSSRSLMIWLRQGRRSNRISKLSVRSVSRKGKSEMTLNSDRFFGEWKSPSEPFGAIIKSIAYQ